MKLIFKITFIIVFSFLCGINCKKMQTTMVSMNYNSNNPEEKKSEPTTTLKAETTDTEANRTTAPVTNHNLSTAAAATTATTTKTSTSTTTPSQPAPAYVGSIIQKNSSIYGQFFKGRRDTILIKANTILEDLKINGMSIPFHGRTDLAQSDSIKIFKDTGIGIGSKIEIVVKGIDGPASIAASFLFKNDANQYILTHTSLNWKCNGKQAQILPTTTPILNMPADVQLIGSMTSPDEIVCKGVLNQPLTQGEIVLVADDYLLTTKVNGVLLPQPAGPNVWNAIRTMKTNLHTGDTVEICAENKTINLTQNPASLIGSIRFINNDGFYQTINTDDEWFCDLEPALLLGGNNDPNSIWYQANGGMYKGIEPDAQYIWGMKKQQKTCCTRTLHRPRREARMNLLCSQKLIKFMVNNDEYTYNTTVNENWEVTKYFSALVRSGDIITLVVEKGTSTLPGLLVTIKYIDNCGKETESNTGDLTWLADGLPPKVITKKTQYCPEVSPEAKWIWSAAASSPATVTFTATLK